MITKRLRLFLIAAATAGLAVSFGSALRADEVADAAAIGKTKYILCGACHGITGNGEPTPGLKMAPSFQESKLVPFDPEVSALILFKGIKKEDPAAFLGQMMMPLGATMTDDDVANIITYVRSEFGGVKEVVSAAKVAEWRKKYADAEQPTRAELEEMGEKLKKKKG